MTTKSWFFDTMVYIYALSLLFIFSDFIQRNPRAKRMGTGLLVFVWSIQTILLANQLIRDGQIFVFSIFDTLFFFSWLLITLSLIFTLLIRIEFVLFFVSLAGFIVAAIAFFSEKSISPLAASWEVRDELLFIHVSLAIGSYAAYFCSAMFSGMLLFLHAGLKKKQYFGTIRRMPSLGHIQRYAMRAVMIGTPLLMLSLVLGIVWIALEKEWPLLLDVKVLFSILIILIYCIYLWRQIAAKTTWPRMAILNLGAFFLVFLNYMTSSWMSNFH
ncbi:MAG: cytochrome c biogenesis protein CcsA [Paenibacillaceae bacterium]